jgi:hypothetical protein
MAEKAKEKDQGRVETLFFTIPLYPGNKSHRALLALVDLTEKRICAT